MKAIVKNKKSVIIAGIILTILLVCATLIGLSRNFGDDSIDDYKDYVMSLDGTVDEQISQLLSDEGYLSLEYEKRVELVRLLLVKFSLNGYIKVYNYEPEARMFSFQYADGSLGGIMMEEFEPCVID